MTNYTKPEDLDLVWASSGITSRPSDFKWLTGWEQEKPPFEQMNYVHNKHDSWAAYSNQKGIPEWDNSTIYYSNSYVQSNGRLYKSKTNQNTNNNPINDLAEANWRLIFDGNNRLTSEADFTPFGKSLIGTADAGTARTLLGATSIGNILFTATNSGTARNVLGFTTTGENILTATSVSNAQTALGFSTYGKSLVATSNADSALSLLTASPLGTALFRSTSISNAQSYLGFSSYGSGLVNRPDAASTRAYIGSNNASNLNTGTVPAARLPASAQRPLATQAQVNAGTGTNVVTPTTMRFGFGISLGTNGFVKFPSWMGGLLIQWGSVSTQGDGTATWIYPLAFPNTVLSGQVSLGGGFDTGGDAGCSIYNMQRQTATVLNGTRNVMTLRCLAIGY